MWEKIFNLAISNGIWAVLFVILLFYQLKDSKEREIKYQQTIESLGKSLEIIKDEINKIKPISDKEGK